MYAVDPSANYTVFFAVAGHFADALIAQKWTVLSVRRMMTCLGLVCPGIFLLFFSAVNNLALAVMFVYTISLMRQFYASCESLACSFGLVSQE